MPAGSILAGIAALVGTAVSAAGSASSAASEEEQLAEQKRLAKLGQERFERQQEEAERQGRLKGLDFLSQQRFGAQQSANLNRFSKGLIARIGQAQNQRAPGLGVSTVGGK